MKVSFDCPDKINGLLTVTIEEDDFKNDVEKELKNTISMSPTKTTHWGRGALRKCLMIRQSAMLLIILLRIRV